MRIAIWIQCGQTPVPSARSESMPDGAGRFVSGGGSSALIREGRVGWRISLSFLLAESDESVTLRQTSQLHEEPVWLKGRVAGMSGQHVPITAQRGMSCAQPHEATATARARVGESGVVRPGMTRSEAGLAEPRLAEPRLAEVTLAETPLSGTSSAGTSLSGTSPAGRARPGPDLSGPDLPGPDLPGADLSGGCQSGGGQSGGDPAGAGH